MADSGNSTGFGSILDGQMRGLRNSFEMGEKVTGVITAVDRTTLFVDVNARSEAIVDRSDFAGKDGELSVQPGDSIEVYYLGGDEDEMRFGRSLTSDMHDGAIWEAYQAGAPVEGKVNSERTGGYEVQVGSQTGFCPYSQIDLFRQDAGVFIGNKFRFKVIEYDEWGNNLVLSRRQLLEEERATQKAQLQEELSVGDVVDGTVTKLMPFGAFVDIGGTEGLVPMRELAWDRTESAEDVVTAGQSVKVMIREIDWERDRISLSLRYAAGDPWEQVAERYTVGARCDGIVTKLMPFGAFVQLEPGIEGLVHISKLGAGRRIGHPKEVVGEGDAVEVSIEGIDAEQRRISLSMESTYGVAEGTSAETHETPEGSELTAGTKINGTVDGIRDFGVFVGLGGGRTGLLHVSQLDVPDTGNRMRALTRRFQEGNPIEVVVQSLQGDRISLTTVEKWEEQAESANLGSFMTDSGSGGFGSLGDALGNLKL